MVAGATVAGTAPTGANGAVVTTATLGGRLTTTTAAARTAAPATASGTAKRGRSAPRRMGRSIRWYEAMARANDTANRTAVSAQPDRPVRSGVSQTKTGQCQR